MQNYNNQKVNSSSLTSNHFPYNSKKIEKVTNNNHKLAKPQQKGSYSTAPQVQERSKSKDSHHNKKQQNNNKATSSQGHKKGSYKGYDLKKYIKDELHQFQEQESYYSSYNASHVRNKREDIDLPKHSAQYAPSNNSLIIDECFSEPCATQTLSQYLDQYNLNLGRFGTFKVSDIAKPL